MFQITFVLTQILKNKKAIGRITLFMALNSKAKGQEGTPYKNSLFNFYAVAEELRGHIRGQQPNRVG